jgi:DNA mismatch repair protein MutS
MYLEYIQQWKQFAAKYGDQTALFLMVGKFYELYDILDTQTGEGQTNVKQAVETLGITLTRRERDGPHGEDCYFAGFPEQSLQKFAALLTREGWTVVACDQKKDEKGKVLGRPVARIFSPGTHIEIAGADAPYLGGIWMEESIGNAPTYAAMVLDMTTGQLVSYESKCQGQADVWSADDLVHFFQIYSPRETVLWWRGAAMSRPSETLFRRRLGLGKTVLHLEFANPDQQGTFETPFVRQQYLQSVFTKQLSLLPLYEQLHLTNKPLTERVCVSLLSFAEQHLPSAIQNLYNHQSWTPADSVYMGNNTLFQLNYLSQLPQEQSVLSLFQKTQTSLGKRALRERLLFPSSEPIRIRKQLDEVEFAFTAEPTFRKQVESLLRQIHDIARLHRKIVMYTITAQDILALDQSYGCIGDLVELLKSSCLAFDSSDEQAFREYLTVFQDCFSAEKAKLSLQQDDLSFLPDSKAPKTVQCETALAEIRKQALDHMETIRVWVGLPPESLRLETSDSLSYFYSGTKTTLSFVKQKIASSQDHPFPGLSVTTKKSVRGSIEFPLLETLHSKTFGLRHRFQAAIDEELPVLCKEVEHRAWKAIEAWVAFLDVSFTLARVANERGYTKPTIVDRDTSSGFHAVDLRHPLLESIQTRTEYVKHTVQLGLQETDERGWLLYGMNASGKSSLMKAIGISVLLAQAGSYVPATSFTLIPFSSILTRILNQDNLWAGLSSFAVEISELRDIFQRADEWSLVLGDELCSGTESISATSLVAAGIDSLYSKRTRFVFATHLHGLNSLPDIYMLEKLGIWHLRVNYDPISDTLIYDRTLHKGPGGTLYGLEVARAMHLPHDILTKAHMFRKQLLGETALQDAKSSSWNSSILRKECEVCKSQIVHDLEVHHIRQRVEAENGRFSDGTNMNDLRNLLVVCQECHDKHHAGTIKIGVEKQTSKGPQREIQTVDSKQKQQPQTVRKKRSEEELQTIERYLRANVHCSLSRIAYDLKRQEGIQITEGALSKVRASLTY